MPRQCALLFAMTYFIQSLFFCKREQFPPLLTPNSTLLTHRLALSAAMMRFMASMPTFTAPEVSSVMGMARPAFSRS